MGLTRPRLGQFQTTTTAFDDEIIVLNNSASGSNTNDIGIVFERGDNTNTALIWDESSDTFALVNTTEQGSTQGNVSINSYSALKVGNLVSNDITYPTSDGSDGQVIVTDGSGNLSFANSSGGVDWTSDQGATNIHANNYTNTTYTSSDFTHNSLSGVTANEHIDWTTDQGATNIHSDNYTDTNTTYSVGDGGLTTNDFTDADHTKLDGIATSANNYSHPTSAGNEHLPSAVSQTEAGYLNGVTSAIQTQIDSKTTTSYVDTQITNLIGGAPGALDTLNELAASINDDSSYASTVTTALGGKVAKAGDTLTGKLTLDGDPVSNLHAATKQYVDTATSGGNITLGTGTSGNYVASGATSGNGISGSVSSEGGTFTVASNATSANTANTIVFRDASGNFNTGVITGTATTARYADLAENYVSDANYAIGTVLVFGGTQEVTTSTTKEDKRIAGVVSSNPAYLMNSECNGEHIIPIALQGRVPCRVIGVVEKGDIIVSSDINGAGVAWNESHNPKTGSVIGKSLVNKNTNEEEVIEVVVGVR